MQFFRGLGAQRRGRFCLQATANQPPKQPQASVELNHLIGPDYSGQATKYSTATRVRPRPATHVDACIRTYREGFEQMLRRRNSLLSTGTQNYALGPTFYAISTSENIRKQAELSPLKSLNRILWRKQFADKTTGVLYRKWA
jgi:hypothetical protein